MFRREGIGCFIAFLFFCLVWAGPAVGKQVEMTVTGDPAIKLCADEIDASTKPAVYMAKGHVRVVRGEETLTADEVRFVTEGKLAELRGNVVLKSPNFRATCDRLVANFEFNIGKIYNGKVFFPENNYYLSGDEIERTGPDTFVVLEGRATSCDGPDPAWSITGRNIEVEREGFATAWGAAFETKYMPLLYVPWMTMPVMTQRQSGLLIPGVNQSSRDGFTYSQPFFWELSDSKDLTFYLTWMEKRGFEPGIEFRFNDWGGQGVLQGSYLRDNDPPTIEYDTGEVREQLDRYWIRGMANFETPSGTEIKIDLDYPSDPKYLDEFEGSFFGFNRAQNLFQREFGRDLAEKLDPLRKNVIQASRGINGQNLRVSLEYTQNVESLNNVDTIQRLPQIGLDLTRKAIPGTPFYFQSTSDYTFFSRQTNEDSDRREQGHRLDIHPSFYWPIKFDRYLDLEPFVGLRETVYYPYSMEDSVGLDNPEECNNELQSRELLDAGIKMSTNLSRVYNVGSNTIPKIKHRIKPEVEFSMVSEQGQNNLPYWDRVDRIKEEQKIRYGIVNYLVAKVSKDDERFFPRLRIKDADEMNGFRSGYEYRELLRFGVHRSYDLVEGQRELEYYDDPSLEPDMRRPHLPWEFDVEAHITPQFWFHAGSDYDTYSNAFSHQSVEMQAKDLRGDYLYLAYESNYPRKTLADPDEETYEEIRYLVNLNYDEQWSFQFDKRHSLLDEENIETIYRLKYQPQCWSVSLEYKDEPDDKSIAVYFSLLGLGDVGSYSVTTYSTDDADETDTPINTTNRNR